MGSITRGREELVAIAGGGSLVHRRLTWLDDDRMRGLRPHGGHPSQARLRRRRNRSIDPALTFPAFGIGWASARKMLGFRSLLNVIGTDAVLVRGSARAGCRIALPSGRYFSARTPPPAASRSR